MSISLADARFLFDRATGLIRRGWLSLRTRGWQASWQRVRAQFRRVPAAQRAALYLPADSAVRAVRGAATSDAPRGQHRHPGLRPARAHPGLPARAGRASAAGRRSRSSSSTTARRDDTADVLPRRSPACATTAARRTAASSPPATTARRWRAANTWCSSTTTPCRSRAGWMRCCDTFDEHPDAGLVGAQLLYPDGTPAGSRRRGVRRRHRLELRPLRIPARSALRLRARSRLLLSGAAIAIPRALFDAARRFRYALCAGLLRRHRPRVRRARRAACSVLYQPAARVVHDEGTTAGTDTSSGTKAYQVAQPRDASPNTGATRWRRSPRPARLPSPALLHRARSARS